MLNKLHFERLLVTDFCANDFSEIPLAYLLCQLKPMPKISVKKKLALSTFRPSTGAPSKDHTRNATPTVANTLFEDPEPQNPYPIDRYTPIQPKMQVTHPPSPLGLRLQDNTNISHWQIRPFWHITRYLSLPVSFQLPQVTRPSSVSSRSDNSTWVEPRGQHKEPWMNHANIFPHTSA